MSSTQSLPTLVFGPAYLDRVLRVDEPLVDRARNPRPLDASVDALDFQPGEGLSLVDPAGNRLSFLLPENWPGPFGTVSLGRVLAEGPDRWARVLPSTSWRDDLGGMGAGYASALGGELISGLGPESDPTSQAISRLLAERKIPHRPIRVPNQPADWTLLISSGAHGDKLPVGFRGCHSRVKQLEGLAELRSGLRVVASLPNRLAAEALRGPARVRLFAPASRNMSDRDPPVSAFADHVDILCCNRGEWESLADREQVAWRVSILGVTDGSNGATIRFTTPEGDPGLVEVPAFPRGRPPLDTNRAGEAFGSTLVKTLMDAGWRPGVTARELASQAAWRASAAAALVLDQGDFGFPSPEEIDAAIRDGRVP